MYQFKVNWLNEIKKNILNIHIYIKYSYSVIYTNCLLKNLETHEALTGSSVVSHKDDSSIRDLKYAIPFHSKQFVSLLNYCFILF